MIDVKTVHSDTISDKVLQEIIEFCDANADGNSNYTFDHSSIEQANNTLFHVLTVQKRFSENKGGLTLLYDDKTLVGLSGYNRSEFHPDIYISGVRTLIHKKHRNRLYLSRYIIPSQLANLETLKAKCVVWLFDVNNERSLYEFAVKGKLNIYAKNKLEQYSDNIYKDLKILDHSVTINHSRQNVIYRYLDKNFSFCWDQLV